MYHRLLVPVLALTLSACALPDPHAEVPVASQARAAVNPLTLYPEAVRSFERGNSPADVSNWWVREYGVEPQVAEETVQALWQGWQVTAQKPPTVTPIVYAPSEMPPPVPVVPPVVKDKGKGIKAATTPAAERPEAIIQEAHQAARVHPTKRGYFGNTSTHVYQYQPGRIYDVHLTPTHATKVVFPPGERLANALVLDPSLFEIQQFDVGDETVSSTVVTILPVGPTPPTDVSLVTQTGRHYDLHLIIGKIGMLGITWNLMPIPQMASDEPPLRAQ